MRRVSLTSLVEQKLKSFSTKIGLETTIFLNETETIHQQKRRYLMLKNSLKVLGGIKSDYIADGRVFAPHTGHSILGSVSFNGSGS